VAGFVIVVCFAHAFLAWRWGARRAAGFLKVVVAIALAGMLAGLWWYLRPKNGGV
jgi:UDP-N-acetylmuramyl pentapeptide phosphotransferase/UDP-N-acetylglucosamine-1-phosphate transferase